MEFGIFGHEQVFAGSGTLYVYPFDVLPFYMTIVVRCQTKGKIAPSLTTSEAIWPD